MRMNITERELQKISRATWTCPFCRTLGISLTDSEKTSRIVKRARNGMANDVRTVASWMYNGRKGYEQDTVEAMKWYRRAADLGNPQACAVIGFAHVRGEMSLEQNYEQGINFLQKSIKLGDVQIFFWLALENWKRGEIEDSILNFRKGAVCGYDKCLEQMLTLFKSGFITKEEYEFTLRAYQTATGEMESKDREDAVVFLGQRGHTHLETLQLLADL
ncbi:hypothetical protein ACHAWF_000503 [Thalassiosira exigua]